METVAFWQQRSFSDSDKCFQIATDTWFLFRYRSLFLYLYAKNAIIRRENIREKLRTLENFRELRRRPFWKALMLCFFFLLLHPSEIQGKNRNGSGLSWIISVFFIIMNAKLMRVVQQGETFAVQSQKSENIQLTISFIDSRLLELV